MNRTHFGRTFSTNNTVHFRRTLLSALTVHFLSKIILINPEQSLILKQDVNLQCGLAEIGPVFDYFLDSTDREDESTSVHVMFLGDQLENSDESLFLIKIFRTKIESPGLEFEIPILEMHILEFRFSCEILCKKAN